MQFHTGRGQPFQSCPQVPWRVVGNALHIMEENRWVEFTLANPPAGYAELFERIFEASGLRCRPALFWLASAGGRGGFYNNGVIALGAQEMDDITANVRAGMTSVPAHRRAHFESLGYSFWSVEQVWTAVVAFVLSHELGHARQAEQGSRLVGIPQENDADRFAGYVSAKVEFDTFIGRKAALAIGCNSGIACRHGDSRTRAANYDAGIGQHAGEVAVENFLQSMNQARWCQQCGSYHLSTHSQSSSARRLARDSTASRSARRLVRHPRPAVGARSRTHVEPTNNLSRNL
jgi:hypothetical protein